MTTLVTGGAGYIGAHLLRLLPSRDIVVVDDLSAGSMDRIGDIHLVKLDLADAGSRDALVRTMRDYAVDSVVHFAAKKQVGESVERPMRYYSQNIGGLANLLAAMEAVGVDRMIFSSSAAAYGIPPGAESGYMTEDLACVPISPYGETKLIGEWMCRAAEQAWGLQWAALRYFNVAGTGSPELGDRAVFNLIPIALSSVAQGKEIPLFGDDYRTPDGTCIRDYVHVVDLAEAHVVALERLASLASGDRILNVGTGVGSSVRQVLRIVGAVTGRDAKPRVVARRPGDPAVVAADVSKIFRVLGWKAKLGLEEMVSSAWQAWHVAPGRPHG